LSDFAQPGLIATLQRLNDRHLAALERELAEMARACPIALVLPCHARDLHRPALRHIIAELQGAEFLCEVVVSLNGVDDPEVAGADDLFRALPMPTTVLWKADAPGKGANLHAAFTHLAREGTCRVVATQDCDVASFRRADLARLCYAVAHPELGYRFAKAYYSRATDRLYGRVTRLFVAPLLQAVVRVAGHLPLIDFLLSFRYPLSGEVALTRELAAALPAATGWNVELQHLCEIFRRIDPREVCQVDGGGGYDHKHQPAATALAAMAGEIARELFAQLAAEGCADDAAFRAAVAKAYRREAEHAVCRSAALARMNGLAFEMEAERAMVAAFAEVF
jgi:glucosyl-3-phosphoglycerate synthase